MPVSVFVESMLDPQTGEIDEGILLSIDEGRIAGLERNRTSARADVVFNDACCCPGLINAHDHLKYSWPAKIGKPPYPNSRTWLPHLYDRAQHSFLEQLTLEDMYWLGTYKSIFAGVTTVANHSHRLSPCFVANFPIRILDHYARELFVTTDGDVKNLGLGTKSEVQLARNFALPFVVHVGEGIDDDSYGELAALDRMGGLFDRTVLVHAIALRSHDIARIAASGASIVWCPASNAFLFNTTTPIASLLRAGINVALGTDSSCTGAGSLLEELRLAIAQVPNPHSESAALCVLKMVTRNAAHAFGMSGVIGTIQVGASADLLIFMKDSESPLGTFSHLTSDKILLLTSRGRWLMGADWATRSFTPALHTTSRVCFRGRESLIVGSPLGLLQKAATRCGIDMRSFPFAQAIECDLMSHESVTSAIPGWANRQSRKTKTLR
jgi:5-methylthioadenosine/S-adenosylhomocysteine deaminase